MEFEGLREQAIATVRESLQAELTEDQILVFAYRVAIDRPKALERWLFAVLPEMEPNKARDLVASKGKDAWSDKGLGANMSEEGWKALQGACKGKVPNIDKLAETAAKNLNALVGPDVTAELIEAAGGLQCMTRITQRDCLTLGNEAGQFGGKSRKSIVERHELATSDRAARILSSRIVLAARLDYYKGQYKGEALRQEVLYAQ